MAQGGSRWARARSAWGGSLGLVAAMLLSSLPMLAGTAAAQPAAVRPSGVTDAQAAATLSVLQRAMLYNDREAVARLIAFPLRVNLPGGVEQIEDAAAFVRDYPRFVTPTLRRAVLAQRPQALVHGSRGVQVGRGEVWLAGLCVPPGCTSTVVRIVALNPAAEAMTGPAAVPGAAAASAAPPAAAPSPPAAATAPPSPALSPPPTAALPASPPPAVAPAAPAPAAPPASSMPGAGLPTPVPLPAPVPVPAPVPPAAGSAAEAAASLPARAAEAQAVFVNRIWEVRRSNAVAPGTLYAFLSEGTLVIASPNGTPALGRWRVDGDRLTMVETGRPYPVDILVLRRDLFSIRVRGPGEAVDIEFEPAAR